MPFYRFDELPEQAVGAAYATTFGAWVTGERMIVGLMRSPRGAGSKPHHHPNEQFNWIMKGRLWARIEDEERLVEAGTLVHIPANAEHSMVATDEEDVVFLACKDTSWGIHGIPGKSG